MGFPENHPAFNNPKLGDQAPKPADGKPWRQRRQHANSGKKAAPQESEGEKKFTAQVIQLAQMRGWLVAHFTRVLVTRSDGSKYWVTPVVGDGAGWPDLFLVRGKVVMAPELKVGKNTRDPDQEKWKDALEAAGIPCPLWFPKDWEIIEAVLL